jgi:copper chaperone CopZ
MDDTRIRLGIEGMTCGHCAASVRDALQAVPGVRRATVRLESGDAEVEGTALRSEALVEALARIGFDATPRDVAA